MVLDSDIDLEVVSGVTAFGTPSLNVDNIDIDPLVDAPTFGGSTPKVPTRLHFKDVNLDGRMDLVLQYRVADLGFSASSIEGCISGKLDGITIDGCDVVKIVPK